MRIGILGTGVVGTTLGGRLVQNGHEVMLGSRSGSSENSARWKKENQATGLEGNFNDAASFGDIIFNCTMGIASLEAIRLVDKENFSKKILVDVANPLDFSNGMPPRLTICNDHSLGEEIQKLLPDTFVVKALNTVNVEIMVDPGKINNDQNELFICGEHTEAKQTVTHFLVKEFGWHREMITDLGGIVNARATEALLLLLVSLSMKYGTFYQGIKTFRC